MSFCFSAAYFLTAINLATELANVFRVVQQLNQEREQLHQELQQLALTLDGLVGACKATDLDVVFIADFKVCMKSSLDTKAHADRLLLSTGLASVSRHPGNVEALVPRARQSLSEADARSLWKDLRQRAQQLRLMLVCDVENSRILREALRNDKWLRGRVFTITWFEKHRHPGRRCQQSGIVCCSEEGPDLVLWSIIRLLEECKKQSFAKDLGKLKLVRTRPSFSGPSALYGTLHWDKLGRTQATVRVLQHVAFAFRPLHVDELLEALTTDHTSTSGGKDLSGGTNSVLGQEDFTELMSEVLEVRDNGLVFFRDGDLRHRVLTEEIKPMEPSLRRNGHEVLATLCLQHLQCLGHETVLKPWASANRWLVGKGAECRLHSYATAFWHDHCRLAESQSRHLPALLHRTISSAIAIHKLESEEHIIALRDKTNAELWVSAAYGLRTLCKTYLEMGADLNFVNNWHKHPLQMLSSRQQHWRLSLAFGVGNGLVTGKDQLQAARHGARFGARNSHRNVQIELQRAFHPRHGLAEGDGRMMGDFCHPGFSPLQMAGIHGHSAILELFQEHPDLALPGLQTREIHRAAESEQCEIHRGTLAENPVYPRASDSEGRVENRRKINADSFAGVRHAFCGLSLTEITAWNGFKPSTDEHATGAADVEDLVTDDAPPEDCEWFFVTREDVQVG